jgi:hypothetical protein
MAKPSKDFRGQGTSAEALVVVPPHMSLPEFKEQVAEEDARIATPLLVPTPFKHRDLASVPRRGYLYGRHYIRRFLSGTVAAAGVGKSSLVIAEAVAMTSGRSLFGIQPIKPLRVWYWNGEDPLEEIVRRVEATCAHFGVAPIEIEGRLFMDSGRETEIIIASQTRAGAVIATPVAEALIDALRRNQIDVLVVDPFVSTHRVTENDNMAIDAVSKTFSRVADAANCSIETVHHVRKTGGGEATAEDGRGASSHVAAARSVRVLNRMSEKEAEQAGVGEERRSYFRSDIDKANLTPPSTKATWFRLANVPLGNGSGGPIDDQDYVGVATPWQWPDAFAGVTVGDLRAVQRRVGGGRWRENSQAKGWVGLAVAEAMNLDASNKAHRARIAAMLKRWIESGALVIVEGLDDRRKPRSFVEVGTPADD